MQKLQRLWSVCVKRNEKGKRKRKKLLGCVEPLNYGTLNVKWNIIILTSRRLWSVCTKKNQGDFRRVIFAKWFSPMFIEPQETYIEWKLRCSGILQHKKSL